MEIRGTAYDEVLVTAEFLGMGGTQDIGRSEAKRRQSDAYRLYKCGQKAQVAQPGLSTSLHISRLNHSGTNSQPLLVQTPSEDTLTHK